MKVLLVSGEYPPMRGGVADYTARLGAALADQGCRVSILTSTRARGAPDGRCAVHPVVEGWGTEVWRRVAERVAREEPDLIHVQYQTGAFGMAIGVNLLPWLIRRRRRRPRCVVTFHDLKEPYLLPKIGPARHLATLALARGVDGVVVTNHEDYRRLASAVTADRTRPLAGRRPLAAIPIGSNICRLPDDFRRDEWRDRIGAGPQETVVGYFGFLVPSKGLEHLITAFEGLIADGRAMRLLMIGATAGDTELAGDGYASDIRRRLADRRLRERVTWTGFLPEEAVAAYLRACDLVCLPFREGASLRHGTLAAAIAQGLPIVTTRGEASGPGANLPSLRDGENVLLVPPADAAGLGAAMGRLAEDPHLRERLASGARDLAAAIAWQRIARQNLDFYKRLLAES